jgi:hypothetical protein
MFKVQSSILVLLLAVHTLVAAETNAPVRDLGDGRFAIGLVTLEQKSRTIRFPATVNMRAETVEYVAVHKTGKTHESILRTEARPQDIHVAMLLLGARPMMTNRFGADGQDQPAGSQIEVEVTWRDLFAEHRARAEDLVQNKESGEALPRGVWIYNGSNFSEGAFTAERDGSVLSIHIDPDALINNPRPGRENDDLCQPFAEKLPPVGTRMEVSIRLLEAR